MYKDYRENCPVLIEIDVDNYELTCGGCPTIYEFKDVDNTKYYFRLRHGYARIECENTGEILIENDMDGFDGICNWEDVLKWAKRNGLLINYDINKIFLL